MRLGFFFIITFSLSALKRFLEQESELARKDYLTGVANGRYFTELASSEINRARRYGRPFLDAMQRNGWPVTFTIGVVTFISPPITVDEMIRMADDLMYSAKRSGKGTTKYEVFPK